MNVAVLLAALIAVLCTTVTAASPALASSSSLPKIQSESFGNWHNTWRVRPSTLVFGSHFLIKNVRYASYGQVSAHARGRLLIDNCRPSCVKGGHYVDASTHFYGVRNHSGPGRFFAHLRLRWHGHSKLLWINIHGEWWWRGA
jgi:hypothetical protein